MPLAPFELRPSGALAADITPRESARRDVNSKRYFGNTVDLTRIESAIKRANYGLMSEITDLAGESRALDLHLSSVLGKRIGKIAASPWSVQPSEARDKKRAKDAAEAVRMCIARIRLTNGLKRLSWGLYNGRAALEIHWQPCAPFGPRPFEIRWMPVELRLVHPRNLSFGPERELRYICPDREVGYFSNTAGLRLDDYPGKFLTYCPDLWSEFPEREGLAPSCLYWTFFKRLTWRMRMRLTELFAVPWRIIKGVQTTAGVTATWKELQDARERVEALGAETTAVLSPGVELDVFQAEGTGMGEFFGMNSTEINAEVSKFVLGQGGTTDGTAVGLNGGPVMAAQERQQDLIAELDCGDMSELISEQLAYTIGLVNWGIMTADEYAPMVVIDPSPGRDRKADLDIAKSQIALGVAVAQAEIREITGLRPPEKEEPLAQLVEHELQVQQAIAAQPVAQPDAPSQPIAAPAPSNAKIDLTPSDVGAIVTVNQALASMNIPPRTDGDGELTVAQFKAKHAVTIAAAEQASEGGAAPAPGLRPPSPPPRTELARAHEVADAIALLMATRGLTRGEAEMAVTISRAA